MSDLISREYMKSLGATCIASRSKDGTLFPIVSIDELPPADPTHPTPSNTLGALDCVSREDLTKGIEAYFDDLPIAVHYDMLALAQKLPSAQSERDIPVKPIETTDKAWGIPNKQAVCPKCDYYLSHISFLGDYKGKRITYCETCGQAIDWEGWDWDEED